MQTQWNSENKNFRDNQDDIRIVAYLLGHDTPHERAVFEQELRRSDLLKTRVYELSLLLQKLQSVPDIDPSPDLTARVLKAVISHNHRAPTSSATTSAVRVRSILLRIAASVVLLLGSIAALLLFTRKEHDQTSPQELFMVRHAMSLGLRWLADAQQSSGMWDAGEWGGDRRHNTGLTGLALMALLEANNRDSVNYLKYVERAQRYLLTVQRENGLFSIDQKHRALDHCIATCALLELYHQRPSRELAVAVRRALIWVSYSTKYSGSAYDQALPDTGDPVHLWTQLALRLAQRDGFETSPIGTIPLSPRRSQPYKQNPRSTPLSLISNYVLARLVRPETQRHNSTAHQHLDKAGIMTSIMNRQLTSGPLAGSWEDLDGFGGVGGRVYSTALAILALCGQASS